MLGANETLPRFKLLCYTRKATTLLVVAFIKVLINKYLML